MQGLAWQFDIVAYIRYLAMKKLFVRITSVFFLIGLGMMLSACGRVSLSLTDAPVDTADAVVIVFTGVDLQPTSGDIVNIEFQSAKSLDLTKLVDGVTEVLLEEEAIPEDTYSGLELKIDIDASYVTVDGADFPLRIPTGEDNGLQVTQSFEVKPGSSSRFIIDFDLRKSLYNPEDDNTDYVLRPKLRMVDALLTGTIAGSVDASLLSSDAACFDNTGNVTAVVYVFSGNSISADDIDGSSPDPVTSARVNATLAYTMPFMEEGDYTLSITCEAVDDDPSTSENINFLRNANVSVLTGQQTTQNFTL